MRHTEFSLLKIKTKLIETMKEENVKQFALLDTLDKVRICFYIRTVSIVISCLSMIVYASQIRLNNIHHKGNIFLPVYD